MSQSLPAGKKFLKKVQQLQRAGREEINHTQRGEEDQMMEQHLLKIKMCTT